MKTLGEQIRTARLKRHMSQSVLARKVGCKQSALSMFEGGRNSALSAATIGKLCDALGLLPPSEAEITRERDITSARVMRGERTFCPNPHCLCNLPITVGEKIILVPQAHIARSGEVHCAMCGEVLERTCPECGASINAGAFCAHCGSPYLVDVPTTLDPHRATQSERLAAWIS